MAIEVSATKLLTFQECPYKFFLAYVGRVQVPKGVKAVFGQTVHQLIAYFHSLSPSAQQKRLKKGLTLLRPKTEKAAARYWWMYCADMFQEEKAKITKHKGKIRFEGKKPEEIEREKRLIFALGETMIRKYWRDNVNAPPPIKVEDYFRYIPAPGRFDVFLRGSIDQIREIPYLDGESGNWYILDLKTEWQDYGIEDPRVQFPVHHDYQFTIYSWVFRIKYSRKEAGIIRYPLGYKGTNPISDEKIDKKALISPRSERDFLDLANLIDFFISCQEKEIFFKAFGPHCRFCDYLEVCGTPELITAKPWPVSQIDWGGKLKAEIIAHQLEKVQKLKKFSQPRLKF